MPDNKEPSDTAGDEAANDVTHDHDDSVGLNEARETAGDDQDAVHNAHRDETDAEGAGDQAQNIPEGEAQADDSQAHEPGDAEPEDQVSILTRQLAEAESKVSDYWDKLLRLQAEMENQRKRAQNDVTKARKFALEGIVNDLLPVRDSLEMGLAAAMLDDADPKSIVEGAELTLKMLTQLFEKNNIVEINPVDEKFDPEFHQAMSMQEVEGKAPNTVTSVMQKGYTLNERLVRPALVMVSK